MELTMSQILARASEPELEPMYARDHLCHGPSECYWHSQDKTLAVAQCFDKMQYGQYIELMDQLAALITDDVDEQKQQSDLLARVVHKWAVTKKQQ